MPIPLRSKIKKATSTPRGKVIAATILLVLLSAVALVIIYWNAIKKEFIRDKVKTVVESKSEKLYTIHYDDMKMDEVAGNLSVTNLTLNYDTARYLAIHNKKDIPAVLFHITIPSIIATGVQTPQALITKEIIGTKLHISNPVIDIIYTHKGKDASKNVPQSEVYREILGNLQLIKLDTFLITGAKIITRDLITGKEKLQMLDTYIELRDVSVDSTSNLEKNRLLFANHLQINCKKLSWSSSNGYYNYEADSIALNSDEKNTRAARFRIMPTLDEETYARKKAVAADRYNISMDNIEINQINFQELFNEKIEADNIVMTNSSIKIYRDMTLPHDHKNRIGTYPQQDVAKIPLPVTINTLSLKNTYVEYKEKGRIMQKIGKVIFTHLNANFKNITNQPVKKGNAEEMTAEVNGLFLNRYMAQTYWTFYLFNKKGRFDLKGHLGSLDARGVNEIAEPLGGAKIEKGTIRALDFNFKADNYGMAGTVKLLYNDLKISVLKKDEETKELKKKKLASFGANILIKDNNPSRNEPPRIAEVDFKRDTTRSMFYLSWKTLMDGIKTSVIKN
ncbi:MAG: hypothetical protein QM802_09100 [Agriterribacter sp.]